MDERSAGERWISFLRAYGPINKVEGMYAETIAAHARRHGLKPLLFDHPRKALLEALIDPANGQLTNLVLTGTAGDGKTSLCHTLWDLLGGSAVRSTGQDRGNYLPLTVQTPDGERTLHFIFEFSGWTPSAGQPWPEDKADLMRRLAASVKGENVQDYFIVAANDGKLVQVFDRPPPGTGADDLGPLIDELLATDQTSKDGFKLTLLNLSLMRTADIFERALDCLLNREEWRCLEGEATDPAFSAASPLRKNFNLLSDPAMRERLCDLTRLLDANGLHVSIREVLMLLVNALLGCPSASDGVAGVQDLRRVVEEGDAHDCALYGNLFGGNLKTDRRRDQYAVFRHLAGFRIGQETTNSLDSLIIFGAQDDRFKDEHHALLVQDPFYGPSLEFERLRDLYLEDDEDPQTKHAFMAALTQERRRLFFRLPAQRGPSDPWRLSVFHAAGDFQRDVLTPLAAGRVVDPTIVRDLVRGLNRVWTGMLIGENDKLLLTTGLDLTTARVSEVFLNEISLQGSLHGDGVTVLPADQEGQALLRVKLSRESPPIDFRLTLVRYEFLSRVSQGALPGSFSKECNEDILAFKSQVLTQFYSLTKNNPRELAIIEVNNSGGLERRQLSVMM